MVSSLQIIAQDQDNFSIDCHELNSFSPLLYHKLCTYPREVIPILDDVISKLGHELRMSTRTPGLDASQAGEQDNDQVQPINVRPYNLVEERAIRDLDPNDIEALVQVDGMVTRVSSVMPDMRYASFSQCFSQCLWQVLSAKAVLQWRC
jgi:DNA replication licensing factor MCM4